MKIAVKWMTPVILLTDGYLANGSEPFRIPDPTDLPKVEPKYQTAPNYDGAVHAVPARRQAHPAVGHPGHARPRAPHRRPREGLHVAAWSPTTA